MKVAIYMRKNKEEKKYTPSEVAEILRKKYNEYITADCIKNICNHPYAYCETDFVKKGFRYYVTEKGLEELMKYYSIPKKLRNRKFKEWFI